MIALKIIIGLLFFWAGLRLFSGTLKSLGRPELLAVIDNPWAMAGVALTITLLVQSSSITTSLIVAVVASGYLGLPAAIGGIVGANLGTTLTAWIAAGFLGMEGAPRQVALAHTLLNLGMAMVALPFARHIASVIERF